jgi:hypothetical protein
MTGTVKIGGVVGLAPGLVAVSGWGPGGGAAAWVRKASPSYFEMAERAPTAPAGVIRAALAGAFAREAMAMGYGIMVCSPARTWRRKCEGRVT